VATYGIVFFATPHRGGNHAKFGDIAASVARAVLQYPDNTFIEALKKDSLFADSIIEDFKHQLENFFILNFFETLPYKNMGLVGYLCNFSICLVLILLDR
jgi:protein SERAC1